MKKRVHYSTRSTVWNVENWRSSLILLSLLLAGYSLQAQDYETTGASSDWFDPAAWICTGGGCNANPVPDNIVRNTTISINHSLTYDANSPIELQNNGSLIIRNNAILTLTSNLNVKSGGLLDIDRGQISIGPGVLNNTGQISLTDAYLTKDGNIVNDTQMDLNNSCINLVSGNFNNNGSVNGTGGLKVLSGNINNFGSWSTGILYYFANNSTGLPGSPSTEEEVDAFCECILINCDIVPGYPENSKYDGIIGSALFSLANNFDPAVGANEFIYQIRDNGGVYEVLIEIIMFESNYNAVVAYLGTFGISTTDFISDVYDPQDDERVITLFFPISGLLDLDMQEDIVRQVFEVSQPIPNTGLIDSQGDFAQNSIIARLGWSLSGAGVKIGVISDSFDRKSGVIAGNSAAVQTDITNGDLPGGANAVTVVQDYPYGPATDEGRAMLQIIHDVAPDAELYFHTGSVSEGNMASAIADLVTLGCDLIVDDLTYMKGPFFTDGVIADAVEAATTAGVSYFSSAGNFGVRSFEGTFTPIAGNPVRHDFGGTDLQQLNLGVGQYIIVLQWIDPWSSLGSPTGATKDLDIYLANPDGSILYGFNRDNNGDDADPTATGNDPVEIMPFNVLNPTTTYLVIENVTGGPVDFKYVVFRAGDDGQFAAVPALDKSTVVGHANAASTIAVGAVRYDNTPNFGGAFLAQQSSSRGGTSTDGSVRQQPLIMSPTGGDTSVNLGAPDFESNGLPNFFGTSASAPHAAGIAALTLEAKTNFGVDPGNTDPNFSIRNLLTTNATDMGPPGYDVVNGFGFVEADNVVGSFANPSPNLIQFNLDNLDPTLEPGDTEFVVIIEGEYFTEESVVIFRDEELETTFIDENTLEATIPEFIGNPPIYVFTPPNVLTNGTDGGDSNVLTFDDPVKLDVVVRANDETKRYGESNPTFSFTTDVDETGNPLAQAELDLLTPSVTLSTAATGASIVGIYAIEVDLTNIDVGLLELYNFIAEPGVLIVDPMPVTIQPAPIDPIVYGDPLPAISFEYTYGDPGGTPVAVDPDVASTFATNHTNILSLANGGFAIVNAGDLTNIISIVNDEPFLNLLSLVNINIYASESTLDQAGTAQQNLLSIVNGTGDEKVVFIGADLFDPDNIESGELSEITNLVSLVNILSLANGTSIVNGVSITNGVSLTNILSITNGIPIANIVSLVNGAMSLVNGTPITNSATVQSVFNALTNSYSIVNTSDIPADPSTAPPIPVIPLNMYTGCNAGTQYVIPGGIIDENFIVYYLPREFEVLQAPLTVTTQDASTTYGAALPEFTAVIDGIVPKDTETDVFPDGLDFSVPCTECDVTGSPYIISASSTNASSDYTITYNNVGLLTVDKFDLTVTVDDGTITYGDTGPFAFTVTSDPAALPYGELLDDVLGPLSFTPSDGCTTDTTIAVSPEVQPDDYNVTYVAGALTINNAPLSIEVLPSVIAEGDATPTSFNTQATGLVCGDPEPVITNFIVRDLSGNPVSGILAAGEYTVEADVSTLTGYDQYNITTVQGQLIVNPSVGCNDRIKASDLCQQPAALPGFPTITTRLEFTYENRLDTPIYVPLGPNNRLKGNAFRVGTPPELFLPGTHTFEIFTDGGGTQWEIKTPGCNSAFKSANGSNADPCSTSAKVDVSDFDESIVIEEGISGIYPNPVESTIVFPMHGQQTSFSIKVFNEVGMLMLQKEYPENTYYDVTLDISMLKSGMLYFMIEKNGKREVHRIFKR